MNGKTHFVVGIATGTAMVAYGALSDNALIALGMITAPIGAMLPDMDHHSTKIGVLRANVMKAIKIAVTVFILLSIFSVVGAIVLGYLEFCFEYVLAVVPCVIFMGITKSESFRKKFKFLTKHRGIMHTLVVPVCLTVVSVTSEVMIVKALIGGLALGYLSHLLADSLTTAGCPIGWPVSQEDVNFASIRTGSFMEYVAAAILCIAIVCYGVMLAQDVSNVWIILVLVAVAVGNAGYVRVDMTLRRLCKKRIAKILYIFVGITVCIVCLCLFKESLVGKCVVGLSVGVIKGAIKDFR